MEDVRRNATLSDLAGIMEVETSWPEGIAPLRINLSPGWRSFRRAFMALSVTTT